MSGYPEDYVRDCPKCGSPLSFSLCPGVGRMRWRWRCQHLFEHLHAHCSPLVLGCGFKMVCYTKDETERLNEGIVPPLTPLEKMIKEVSS